MRGEDRGKDGDALEAIETRATLISDDAKSDKDAKDSDAKSEIDAKSESSTKSDKDDEKDAKSASKSSKSDDSDDNDDSDDTDDSDDAEAKPSKGKDDSKSSKGSSKEDDSSPTVDMAKLARKKWVIFLVVGFLSLFADQATKIWARSSLETQIIHGADTRACEVPDDLKSHRCQGVDQPVFGSFWSWRLSMNPGSAFGLFSGQNSARIFLSLVGIAACIGMVMMLRKARTDQKALHWALAFVVGGAIGNLIDRIGYGVVTDFILWKYKTHEWPVFNVADIVLVIGVGLMFIDIQKEGKREKALRKKKLEGSGLVKDHSRG